MMGRLNTINALAAAKRFPARPSAHARGVHQSLKLPLEWRDIN
jgi:hypothetical protein